VSVDAYAVTRIVAAVPVLIDRVELAAARLADQKDKARRDAEAAQAVADQVAADLAAVEAAKAQAVADSAPVDTRWAEVQAAPQPPAVSGGGVTFTVEATAYCLEGTTANGSAAGPGIIAVDPYVIPLGSSVYVEGYGAAIAADTGGAIQGNIIDVWLPCDAAWIWGRRSVTITVY